jgi:O-antigen ligase
VALIGLAFFSRQANIFRPPLGTAELTMFALLAYAGLSMIWAPLPRGGVGPVITGVGCLVAYLLISSIVFRGERMLAQRMAEGLLIGLFVGLIYLGFEILTNQAVKLTLYRALDVPKSWLRPTRDFTWQDGRLVKIAAMDLTRNIAPVTLLLWSALASIGKIVQPRRAKILTWMLAVIAAVVVAKSDHETSKAALVFGAVIFALARYSSVRANQLLQVMWVGVCLAVIPCTLALHRLDLQDTHFLQKSFRHRIVIWNHTSEEALKSPIFGIGAGMMHKLDPRGEKPPAGQEFSAIAAHAHNVYLQTWFELGAVGAALLTLIGLAVLERIRSLPIRVMPYAQATFASTMAMIAASYGMWQPWFVSMFAMCGAMAAVAIRLDMDGSEAATRPNSV